MVQRFLFVILIGLLVGSGFAQAQSYPTRQDPYVNDLGHVLSKSEEDELRALVQTISKDFDLTVLTIDSIADYDSSEPTIEAFATKLFNTWKIGDSMSNKGVLVVLAMRNRDLRIELGEGYASDYNDDMKAVIEEYMIPRFKEDDYAQGLIDGSAQIYREIIGQLPTVGGVQYQLATPYPTPRKWTSSSSSSSSSTYSSSPFAPKNNTNAMLPFAVLAFGAVFLRGPGMQFWKQYQKSRPQKCPACHASMRRLDEAAGNAYLDKGQQLERQLGSVPHQVWECPKCQSHSVVGEAGFSNRYAKCPECHYRTEERTNNLTKTPTESTMGVRQVKSECRNCGREKAWTEEVPFVRQTTTFTVGVHDSNSFHHNHHSSFGNSSSFGSHNDSHHSGGGGGSSSGGNSGGSSSGGGASGSW